jgi:RNA polymerase sigma-70 factor (ECF subfamily)
MLLDNPTPGGLSWQNAIAPTTCPPRRPPTVLPDRDEDEPRREEALELQAAQAGDRAAFAKIVDRYWDRLHRWLYHLTRDRHQAEDLTQETFLKALAAIGSFRAGSNFRAWLFRIGHNNFVNLKRAGKRLKPPGMEEAEAPPEPTPMDAMADKESLAAVVAAVQDLPPDFKKALLLHTQEGLSYREIAAIVKTTEETARWRVFKARQKLMKVLHPDLVPPTES